MPSDAPVVRPRRPLWKFGSRAAVLIALCAVAWSFVAQWVSYPAALLAEWAIEAGAPMWAHSARITAGGQLEVQTTIQVLVPNSGGRRADIIVEADPVRYAYGLPLLFGLLLATRLGGLWRFAAGYALLLPAQAWSLAGSVLMQIGFAAQGDRAALRVSAWQLDAMTYFYQLGALVVPTVVPVLVWIWLDRKYLTTLISER
jgi:hypothetical protein